MAQPELVKDIEARVKKSGDTMTGNLIGKYFQGTWLQSTSITDLGSSPSKIAVINNDGWIYYRTPSELAKDIGLTSSNYVRSFYETNEYFDSFTSNNLVGINYCGAGTGGEFYIGREWGKNSDGNNFGMQLRFSGQNGQLYTRSFNGWGAQWSDWLTYLNNNNFGNYALPLSGGEMKGPITIPNNYALYGILGSNSSTISSNVGGLTWFDLQGTAGAAVDINDTPTNGWWYILRNRHTNQSNNYYTDIAIPFNDTSIYYKIIRGGALAQSWTKLLDTNNYASALDNRYFTKSQIQNKGLLKDFGFQTTSSNLASMLSSNQFTVFTNWWDSSNTYMPYIYGSGIMIPHLDANFRSFIYGRCDSSDVYYGWVGGTNYNSNPLNYSISWKRFWLQGDAVTGAVWNDYAECREADTIEPGYVLVETGDDSLTKSTERLSPFAGVSSDTWGFSQGETDKAKTPIAVAGRVLVYPWQDRNNYKPGDCVCAAPEGKVDIMTREEIIQYPDRIVGTVSSVPTYDKWGGGENADREPVDVNGRIWIKVR